MTHDTDILNALSLMNRLSRSTVLLTLYAAEDVSPAPKTRKFGGLSIAIEHPKGSIRSGKDRFGKSWSIRMNNDYGFIRRANGADGEGLDVYLGPDQSAPEAYVIHQNEPDMGRYDEDKVMLGFGSPEAAKQAYLSHYNRPDFYRSMTIIPMPAFRAMLTSGKPGGVTWKRKNGRDHKTVAMFEANAMSNDPEDVLNALKVLDGLRRNTTTLQQFAAEEEQKSKLKPPPQKKAHPKHPLYDRRTGSVFGKDDAESLEETAQAVNRGERSVEELLDSIPHLAGTALIEQHRREQKTKRLEAEQAARAKEEQAVEGMPQKEQSAASAQLSEEEDTKHGADPKPGAEPQVAREHEELSRPDASAGSVQREQRTDRETQPDDSTARQPDREVVASAEGIKPGEQPADEPAHAATVDQVILGAVREFLVKLAGKSATAPKPTADALRD